MVRFYELLSAMPSFNGAFAVRRARLKRRKAARDQKQNAQIEGWFVEFDTNNSGLLERSQLSHLIESLSGSAPTTEALDYLMRRAVAIDTTGDGKLDTKGITKKAVVSVLRLYADYARDQRKIDDIFAKYDLKKNGVLDKTELLPLLRDLAPEAGRDGINEGDAQYVIDQCDADGNKVISRDEVLPACATWLSVHADQTDRGSKSSFAPAEMLHDVLAWVNEGVKQMGVACAPTTRKAAGAA